MSVPVFKYAIAYEDLLEFTLCPTLVINGPVYAGGSIRTGSSSALVFNNTVFAGGTLSSPPLGGSGWAFTGAFNGTPGLVTNAPVFSCSFATNWHALIEMPSQGESPLSNLGSNRLYNQAQVVLLVTTNTVTCRIQIAPAPASLPGVDPMPLVFSSPYSTTNLTNVAALLPFLSLTNSFFDPREVKTVRLVQVDIGLYAQWLQTNTAAQAKLASGSLPAPLLYVADLRPSPFNMLAAVRLTNGIAPPSNLGLGFSVATPNPLYVLGNYNCPDSDFLGTTNTAAATLCAFYCDALTLLSPAWQDKASSPASLPHSAASTTVNAAILAGNVPSGGTGLSGGVHNLPRLLEDWNSRTLTLNTSLACLYASAQATGPFLDPPAYYVAPTRRIAFDSRFGDAASLPPGTPRLLFTNLALPSVAAQLDSLKRSGNSPASFRLGGPAGLSYAVQASTNLVDWVSLSTNTAPFEFADPGAGGFSERFYRAVFLP